MLQAHSESGCVAAHMSFVSFDERGHGVPEVPLQLKNKNKNKTKNSINGWMDGWMNDDDDDDDD